MVYFSFESIVFTLILDFVRLDNILKLPHWMLEMTSQPEATFLNLPEDPILIPFLVHLTVGVGFPLAVQGTISSLPTFPSTSLAPL